MFKHLLIIENSYNKLNSTIAKIVFSIVRSIIDFKKVKTKTRAFVRYRANDILTKIKFFALRDFNKRRRSSLLILLSSLSRLKSILSSTTLTRRRFIATTITTTQTFFQKHFIENITNQLFFLSKNENDENVIEKKIEKKRFISNNILKSKNYKISKL